MFQTKHRLCLVVLAIFTLFAQPVQAVTFTISGGSGSGTTITDYTGSFDIPSNDPDTASVTISVKGSIQQ